jgi:hypothetical protein
LAPEGIQHTYLKKMTKEEIMKNIQVIKCTILIKTLFENRKDHPLSSRIGFAINELAGR